MNIDESASEPLICKLSAWLECTWYAIWLNNSLHSHISSQLSNPTVHAICTWIVLSTCSWLDCLFCILFTWFPALLSCTQISNLIFLLLVECTKLSSQNKKQESSQIILVIPCSTANVPKYVIWLLFWLLLTLSSWCCNQFGHMYVLMCTFAPPQHLLPGVWHGMARARKPTWSWARQPSSRPGQRR